MAAQIPIRPEGRQDIHRLETYLLIGTLLRKDVLEKIKNAEDRLTWIDSLAVAAGALARHKAGMPLSEIAEELGRTEITIRNHLNKKTEAGKLVWETYEMLVKGELDPLAVMVAAGEDVTKVKEEADKLRQENEELKRKIETIKKKLEELLNSL
jgi:probable regulatory domain-containing protein